ncbi:receptor-interacting serine/threonine-protein kinase 4-like [Xenia sp. Carnegie-2017]|uniref:receptor-interacting serine/threonine-protein kinase 4-like n=1 Tax=Xenia sp. Carnegie-2017 TaxID=2897299 RepID=UPI001F0491FF|nr:receptor-interacting serine/threonine-protein kinase 4-like [Xenia sp. Carnegie-2017]
MMNLCESSQHFYRTSSSNKLMTRNYPRYVAMRVSNTDDLMYEMANPNCKALFNALPRSEPSLSQSSIPATVSQFRVRQRFRTLASPSELRSLDIALKRTKSLNTPIRVTKETDCVKRNDLTKVQDDLTCKSFKEDFDHSSIVSSQQKQNTNVKLRQKDQKKALLLRSVSSSRLSPKVESRPKLVNRLSCPDNLIPPKSRITLSFDILESNGELSKGTKSQTQLHGLSKNDNNGKNVIVNDESRQGTTSSILFGDRQSLGVPVRVKKSVKFTNSMELTKRNSQRLVTRFEIELAITDDNRDRFMDYVNSKSVNLNAQDYYGKTLLHTAASVGNCFCARILVDKGAQVDVQDQAGFTPLHCAVVANHVSCAAALIAAGSDVLRTTRTYHTALTLAHEVEMILLIGRTLLLSQPPTNIRSITNESSLRETNL